MSNCPTSSSRRQFLNAASVLGAGIVIAPGITLHGISEAKAGTTAVTSKVRWGLLVDANKCTTDCTACVSACKTENGLESHGRDESDPQWIRKVELRDKGSGRTQSLPVMCQHCDEPPCVDVCPTGASFKRADGIVLVDKHICIGCRYCMMACPYKARSFVHETTTNQKSYAPRGKGTVESCTFCVHRVDAGRQPACVEACHKDGKGAMTFGDLKDPNSDISKKLVAHGGSRIRGDLGLDPGVRYQGV